MSVAFRGEGEKLKQHFLKYERSKVIFTFTIIFISERASKEL
jgi:hypothetical protein